MIAKLDNAFQDEVAENTCSTYKKYNKLPDSYVDFDKVKNIQIVEEKNETEEVCVIDESCFQNAKQQDLENWKSKIVYNIEVAKSD